MNRPSDPVVIDFAAAKKRFMAENTNGFETFAEPQGLAVVRSLVEGATGRVARMDFDTLICGDEKAAYQELTRSGFESLEEFTDWLELQAIIYPERVSSVSDRYSNLPNLDEGA